jgi:hypothetical protein
MTHVDEQGNVWIAVEPDGRCELCGAVEETRPYGPGFKQVCHPCAMKDEAGAAARMAHKLFGEPLPEQYR